LIKEFFNEKKEWFEIPWAGQPLNRSNESESGSIGVVSKPPVKEDA
jgi:hypothetical protein